MQKIDNILNKITMYKVVLYALCFIFISALVLSYFGELAFSPQALLYSTGVLLVVSLIANEIFSRIFRVATNIESVYITAFILTLIITPPFGNEYLSVLPLLIWAGIWSQASKYIVAIYGKHIFNPVAFAVALTALTINNSASWWIGTAWLFPFVLIAGFVIVRKIRRYDVVFSFLIFALITMIAGSIGKFDILSLWRQIFLDSPFVFFATVMLTEPITMPPSYKTRVVYGFVTGVLYAPFIHFGNIFSTPELALCFGNIYSWLASPKKRYVLTLEKTSKIARDTGEFEFSSNRKIKFQPGQYMEFTLAHEKVDSRGNRRYFTIASSPTEQNILLGIKFDKNHSSSFKKALAELQEGETVLAGQIGGDFILPKDKNAKLCFIAGGIGITPFRSMIQYLLDKNEQRDINLIYCCKRFEELAYTNIFHRAVTHNNLKTISTLTDVDHVPEDWKGYKGFIDAGMVLQEVPDYAERIFYISGPNSLVVVAKKMLLEIGVNKNQIKTDYFPGF